MSNIFRILTDDVILSGCLMASNCNIIMFLSFLTTVEDLTFNKSNKDSLIGCHC